ncbi:MAG: VanZ family protein [Pseudomonadota bacterium]
MLPLRYPRRWRIAGGLLLAAVFAATLMPMVWFWEERRQLLSWLFDADKWLHTIVFAFLALWFSGQYAKRDYWRIGLWLSVFGVAIELCQRMVAHRTAEWADLAADVVGIVIGLAIAAFGVGGWSLHVEKWFGGAEADRAAP